MKHEDLTAEIIGIFYDVYNELGFGFLESVYEEAMRLALEAKGLTVRRQVPIPVWFRGKNIGNFKADLVVGDQIIIELKAVKEIDEAHIAQLINYLRATDIEVGLLINFGHKAQLRRKVFDNHRKGKQLKPESLLNQLFTE